MAFEEVKARLVADPVLACPDFSITFILQTDASDYVIGAILTQDTEINWDEKWPEIMLAVSTSTSESTGHTPAFLTQGREPRLPSSLYDKEGRASVGSGT